MARNVIAIKKEPIHFMTQEEVIENEKEYNKLINKIWFGVKICAAIIIVCTYIAILIQLLGR